MRFKKIFSAPIEVIKQSEDSFGTKIKFIYSYFLYYISKHIFKYPISKFPEMNLKVKNCIFKTRKKTIDFWMCLNSYESRIWNFLNNKKDITFIDIGANIGKYTVPLGKKFKVISFEPLKSNFNQLKINAKINNSKPLLYNIGLGDSEKEIEISYDPNEQGEASIVFKVGKEKEKIKIVPLDKILKKEKNPILKIDVEGFEYEVLKGAEKFIKKNHPEIIIEIWKDKTKQFLKKLNYIEKEKGIWVWKNKKKK